MIEPRAASAVVLPIPLFLCMLMAAALSACGGASTDDPSSASSATTAASTSEATGATATAAAVLPSPQPMPAGLGSTALSWTAPRLGADLRPISGLTGYKLYRATSKTGPYTVIATITNPSTLSYVDTGLSSGTYYYAISTTTVAGESDLGYVATKAGL